ncbi:hypothetical protein TYRP_015460 [Tyrophagus putrescentiae]|nr:hypothetical protein TYRP_015460 [Tyrophagus putrescentiae]
MMRQGFAAAVPLLYLLLALAGVILACGRSLPRPALQRPLPPLAFGLPFFLTARPPPSRWALLKNRSLPPVTHLSLCAGFELTGSPETCGLPFASLEMNAYDPQLLAILWSSSLRADIVAIGAPIDFPWPVRFADALGSWRPYIGRFYSGPVPPQRNTAPTHHPLVWARKSSLAAIMRLYCLRGVRRPQLPFGGQMNEAPRTGGAEKTPPRIGTSKEPAEMPHFLNSSSFPLPIKWREHIRLMGSLQVGSRMGGHLQACRDAELLLRRRGRPELRPR